jgi:hypothetical protein
VASPIEYCFGGIEESKVRDGDAAATFAHAVAPVGATSEYCCGGVEESKGCDGDC